MSRTPVFVRDGSESDAAALLALWRDLLPRTGVDIVGQPVEETSAQALGRIAADPDHRVVVAEVDGVIAGAAFLRCGLVSPLHTDRTVHLSHLQVAPRYERFGVGHALLEVAVTWAEQRGVTAMTAATAAGDRDANRFLARLGMAQVAALRVTSVAALRARMPSPHPAVAWSGARPGRSVGQVVAMRRSQLRARSRSTLT